MKYIRFEHKGIIKYGIEEKQKIMVLDSDFLYGGEKTGETLCFDDIKLLCPTVPSKIVGVGRNYAEHLAEVGGGDRPDFPVLFIKLPHTLTAHDCAVVYPAESAKLDYEGELGIVISEHCSKIKRENAASYIFGLTCLNDVTARDLQRHDGQWTRGKNFEHTCPVGPWIETDTDYKDIYVRTYLNGELKQEGRTSDMFFSPEELVYLISGVIPLEKGDIIASGTPGGIGQMIPGDIVEIEIEGVGRLCNIIKKGD